jgi:hypothetical protein
LHGDVGYQGFWSLASIAIPYLSDEAYLHEPGSLEEMRMPQEERKLKVEY